MQGITIIYDYDGDEAEWERATADFVAAIDADAELAGKFHYRVNKAKEGPRRVHWAWWDDPATVQALQSRNFFKAFSAQVKSFAGESLKTVPITAHAGTAH